MKARPILMSAPMVRALLEGRKTQTRRIVKPQPISYLHTDGAICAWEKHGFCVGGREEGVIKSMLEHCPYGQPGDLLWVRESIWLYTNKEGHNAACYPADAPDGARPLPKNNGSFIAPAPKRKTPSLHMPRWASRLTLEITDVRVERLHNIGHWDARMEGCPGLGDEYYDKVSFPGHCPEPVRQYQELWESINGAGSWELNPWVWALTFKVHRQNVDAFIGEPHDL